MTKKRTLAGENDDLKPVEASFPTVGIGASAGGLSALQTFLREIPAGTGAAYVVIVHLEPAHASELAEILARKAHIPVRQVDKRMTLEPDNIYVIPPNRQLRVVNGEIDSLAFDEPRGRRSPIDLFFRSLADQHGDGFAVILTGAGSDGAVGAKAIKEAGGIILVQDPDEAEYPSMPRSAIATGLADVILPVRELARQLVELIKSKARIPAEIFPPSEEETFKRILAFLRVRTGHDFLRYKRSTIYRRLARRMQVCKADTLCEYLDVLKLKPEELQSLFHDLLISVTTFFRDPEAFDALAQRVLPKLYDMDGQAAPIRVWAPGCASGEEAYSLAMLFAEEGKRRGVAREVQIFASDLDSIALSIARDGLYPQAIEADVSEERLRKYFKKEDEHYRVGRQIREMVLFAAHSLLKDPPFSRLDLISCRNVLIYLEKDLQQQVLSTFNYALKPGGYLFLGRRKRSTARRVCSVRSTGRRGIYQSQLSADSRRELPYIPAPLRRGEIAILSAFPPAICQPAASHQRALEAAAPPSMLIDANYRIVQHVGERGPLCSSLGWPAA